MRRHFGPEGLIFCIAVGVVLGTTPASASCSGPPVGQTPSPPTGPIFEGQLVSEVGGGTAGTLFEFSVDSVVRGEVPKRVVVDITVDKSFRRPDGQVIGQTSSNSIGAPPKVGGRYRVEAYRGNPGGRPRLFVNGCGGSLRRLSAKPGPNSSVARETTPSSSAGGFWSEWGLAAAIGALAVLLIGLAFKARRRSMVS